MSDIANVKQHFTRAAVSFDSLYDEEANSCVRFINHRFRRDIYERFVLSINHVRKFNLTSILDVGCGSGRYVAALVRLGVKRIVGIDVSGTMIALAKRRVAEVHNSDSTLEFVCRDFMGFESAETFQLALAMGVFDYVKDPLPLLIRLGSFATHSVIASFPSISWYRTPIRKMRYFIKRCPVYFYNRSQIEALASAAGYQRTHITKIEGAGQDYFVTFYKPGAVGFSVDNGCGEVKDAS